jgi:hypothetical protein
VSATQINPITYVLEAMRGLINGGWEGAALWQGALACLILAVMVLRVRTRRA